MKIRDIVEGAEVNDPEHKAKLQAALKDIEDPGRRARKFHDEMSDETKAKIQAYKDKRFGTKAEQKARAEKGAAEIRKITKDAGPWTSGGEGPLD